MKRALLCLLLLASTIAWASSATTTTLVVSSNGSPVSSVAQGTVVTLTATVIANSRPAIPGIVLFCDNTRCTDIHRLATASVNSAGVATYKFRPGPGNHSYHAAFLSTTTYAGGTSATVPLSVVAPAKTPTATAIAASGSGVNYTLTADTGGNGATAPTGTISFLDTSNGNAVLTTASLGAGTGFGFVNSSNLSTGGGVVATGDFNGDGIPDLAVEVAINSTNPNAPPSGIMVLLGNGDGTFKAPTTTYPTGLDPIFIAIADFNGDGIPDLAVANAAANTVTILLGNGDGTFTPVATSPATGDDPVSIAVGDFNRDGIPDLAVADSNNDLVTILLGKGDGTFTWTGVSPATGIDPDSIVAGDFNGDGILDLAIANVNSNTVTVLLGDGHGNFTTAASPTTSRGPDSIVTGDFNGDGILDLATANLGDSNTADSITVLLGNGDGTFTPQTAIPLSGPDPVWLALGDFNGDGIADLAVSNEISDSVTVLLGNGSGSFTPASANFATGSNPYDLAVADFNGDGLPDIAVGDSGSYHGTSVYSGYGVTTLLASKQIAATAGAGITLGNGPHVIVANYPGDGNYAASMSAPLSLAGPTEATTLTLTASPAGTLSYNESVTLTATLAPSTYQSHTADGETVTFSTGSTTLGTGTLSGGVAILVIPATSSMTVTVAYAGDSYLSSSTSNAQSLTVIPRQSTTLSLSIIPSGTLVPGAQATLIATLSPSAYQGHNTDGETITFNSNNGALGTATLSGGTATLNFNPETFNTTVSAAYAGDNYLASSTAPTLYLSVQPVGTTMTVTATPSPATFGEAVTFTATVSPASAQGLGVSGTVNFYAGQNFLASAGLGNGVASVTLSIYPTQVPLSGSYTLTAQYPGNAAFAAASAQASAPFVVNPEPTSTLLTASPNPALAGTAVTLAATTSPFPIGLSPNGQTIFYDGNTEIGVDVLSPTSNVANLTVSNLSPGVHSITAQFGGNTYQAPSTSQPVTLTINGMTFAPVGGSGTPSQTVSPGGKAAYSLAVAPPSGQTIAAPVTFGVNGLPSGATAVFSPASLPVGSGATNVTLTVTVPTTSSSARESIIRNAAIPVVLCLLLLPVFASRKNRLRTIALLMLLAIPAAMTFTGCGSSTSGTGNGSGSTSGSGNGGGGGGSNPPPPQAKTYNLTITATSSSVTLSVPATLIVQ